MNVGFAECDCSKDVRLPIQMQRAMAAEAESAREAKAKVCIQDSAQGQQPCTDQFAGALLRGGLGWTLDTSTPLFSEGVSGIESLWSILISFRLYPQTLPPTWDGILL